MTYYLIEAIHELQIIFEQLVLITDYKQKWILTTQIITRAIFNKHSDIYKQY